MNLEWINEAIGGRRQLGKRLLCLAALSVLALLILAPDARAQSGNLDPSVTQPCPFDLDQFPEGTVCGEGGAYINPETGTAAQPIAPPPGTEEDDDTGGEITCGDFEDQGQAQEALNRGLSGDPAYPPNVLDEDGDGIACEDLPTAFDPNTTYTCENFLDQARAQAYFDEFIRDDPEADRSALDPDGNGIACEGEDLPTDDASDEETDEESPPVDGEVSVGEGSEGEKTRRERRERRERTGAEETSGAEEQPADEGGESPSSEEGGSDGAGNDSAGGNNQGGGASQGGVSGAVNDGFGSILTGRLPNTGGGWAVLLVAGAVLIVGGVFLIRRFSSST